MAYNILDSGRKPEFFDVLKEENADIAMLVETDSFGLHNNAKLNDVLSSLNTYFSDENPYSGRTFSWCDETIISSFPIIEAHELKTVTLDNGNSYNLYRMVLHAVIDIGDTDIHLFGVHFKCCEGEWEETRREQDMEGVINYMDNLGEVPIIYLGDFNCFSPFDTGELSPNVPNLGTRPIEMLLNRSNPQASEIHTWIDCFRELNPIVTGYSYIDAVYQNRIDFIFTNHFFTYNLINATVGDIASAEIGSDHFSVDLWLNMDPSIVNLRSPSQVTGLNGSVLYPMEVNLTWTPNEEDISQYIIYRDTFRIANVSSSYCIASDLIAGQNY